MMTIQDFTLHTHTIGFDGKNTSAEMVATARDSGFKTIGISNHFIVHPDIKQTKMFGAAAARGYDTMYNDSFDEALAKFLPHYEELARLQEQNPDIRILRGMEVDFFSSAKWRDGFSRACEILKPDYLIGAAHFVEYGGTVCNVHDIAVADSQTCDEMLSKYWKNIQILAGAGLFNWLAHLDLPKKRGLGEHAKWDSVKKETIQVIANTRVLVEINTSGYKIGTGQPYPDQKIMEMLAEYDVPVLLSDDAHDTGRIGCDFEQAHLQACENGIKNFANLQKILDFRDKRL